jgi:hypothetical protein
MNKKLKMNYTQEGNQIDRLPERRNNLLPDEVGLNMFFLKIGNKTERKKLENLSENYDSKEQYIISSNEVHINCVTE